MKKSNLPRLTCLETVPELNNLELGEPRGLKKLKFIFYIISLGIVTIKNCKNVMASTVASFH
jgi:hypothetical protein